MKGYPRPQFARENWINLNGIWDFCFDDQNQGLEKKYYNNFPEEKKILVPFAYETKLSGINDTSQHDIVWYRKTFYVDKSQDYIVMLNFGAVDYHMMLYLNDYLVGEHQGGHTSFSFDITDYISYEKNNNLVIRVYDPMKDLSIPRGKQYWKEKNEGIYYTKTTGIWQTVWIEKVPEKHLLSVKITPDIDNSNVKFEILTNQKNSILDLNIEYSKKTIIEKKINLDDELSSITIDLENIEDNYWSPENPNLYDVSFVLNPGSKNPDIVKSYFGLRKISVNKNQIYLNNKPYYLRLVLDQGYYLDSLLTSKTDEDLINDIKLTKAMGFNGVRKHQKIEEERYLYYADKMGLLVWGELPSAFEFTKKSQENLLKEWKEVIKRDFNHPSIITWVPINESWGVPNLMKDKSQIEFTQKIFRFTKKLDPTRLVVFNDGWELGETDLFNIHDYESDYDILKNRYSDINKLLNSKPGFKNLLIPGFNYNDQPILVSEFGGVSYAKNGDKGWGYSVATSDEDFEKRLQNIFKPIYESPFVKGFCYTQLTDVQQEINGLLTASRKPKISIEKIKKIVCQN